MYRNENTATKGLPRNRPMPSGARPHNALGAVFGVLAALSVVVGANAAGLLDKGEGGSGDALEAVTSSTVTPSTAAGSPAPNATLQSAPSTVAAVPPTKGPPSESNKLFLFVAGDSDAQNLGPPLQRSLEATGVVESELHYKASSGLSRPDFYDWPKALIADVERLDPDIVVVTFGGNDAQPINGAEIGSAKWTAEYRTRVGQVMDFLAADGRTLFWVGIPSAKGDAFRARQIAVRDAQAAEATKRPEIVYIDAWNRFSGLDTDYADYIADPRDNEFKLVRQDDGFHLNGVGAEILALDVEALIMDELRTRGADL